MKAEINFENKAKFFAMYWGQDIVSSESDWDWFKDQRIFYKSEEIITSIHKENYFLSLIPLSQISDEDAIEVARIENAWELRDEHENIYFIKRGKSISRQIYEQLSDGFSIWLSADKYLLTIDHLRSKGYALPWMGFSVEEMIEASWVKLF